MIYAYDLATITLDGKPIGQVTDMHTEPNVAAAAKAQGIATIPFGILGPLRLPGTIEDVGESTNGVHLEFGTAAWDRVLAMAVERAITNRPTRVAAVSRAILGESAMLHRLGDVVLRKKGERKKRRAMRRLLRAAGITRRAA